MSKDRLLGVQILRGIAANMVVLYHFKTTGSVEKYNIDNRYENFNFFRNFDTGVDLFFVISGFIMFYVTDGRSTRKGTFVASRLMRIVPLYWLISILEFAISNLFLEKDLSFSYLFRSMSFTVNTDRNFPVLGQGWTLQYEMLFYLVLSFFLLNSLRRKLFFCLVILCGFRIVLPIDNHVFEFLFGAFSFILAKHGSQRIVHFLAALSGFFLIFMQWYYIFPNSSLRILFFGVAAIAIVSYASITKVNFPKILIVCGDYSYSLYLTHTLVISVMFKIFLLPFFSSLNPFVFLIFGVLLCNFIGYLCWKFVERPLSRFLQARLRDIIQ